MYKSHPGLLMLFSGRTHAANVKNVNDLKAAVNVEWQEDGASKGKEVTILNVT